LGKKNPLNGYVRFFSIPISEAYDKGIIMSQATHFRTNRNGGGGGGLK
jgi:hypothetical protein